MKIRSTVVRALPLLVALQLQGCTKAADWTDPEYIAAQMEVGSDQAFAEFTRLSAEQQQAVVPTLVDLYNRNFRREKALQALLASASPAARDVFRAALQENDALASLGARGLAAIGDRESAASIAQRLGTVTTTEAYSAFLDALRQIPTNEAGDVVAEIMMRPAPRIGGINTVRAGCTFLGSVEDPSDSVIGAMVFGLVNFIPQPFDDALNECELALLAHADRAAPKLIALFNGTDTTATQHLRSMRYRPIVGSLRAAAVLAHAHTDTGNAALIQWFSTPFDVPMAELRDMPVAEQQNWYDQAGQLFTQAVNALGYRGTDDDLAALRRLEALDAPQSLLTNFNEIFALSASAEFGIRTAVHDALSKAGNDTDRELLWTRAQSGTVTRGGTAFANELRKNALHFVGRTARPGELARYEALVAALPENERINFVLHRAYFLLAEQCADNVSCYVGALTDTTALMQHESIVTTLAAFAEGAERNMMTNAIDATFRTGATWQLALRFGTDAAAGEALVANIAHPSTETRTNIGEALIFVDRLPADYAARLDEFLTADAENRSPVARAYRHQLRVVKAIRARGA